MFDAVTLAPPAVVSSPKIQITTWLQVKLGVNTFPVAAELVIVPANELDPVASAPPPEMLGVPVPKNTGALTLVDATTVAGVSAAPFELFPPDNPAIANVGMRSRQRAINSLFIG